MRKLILAALSVLAIASALPANAAENKIAQLTFRTSIANRNPAWLDSLSTSSAFTGSAMAETTSALSTEDWDFDSPTGIAGTTSQPVARLFVYSNTTAFAGDSIYAAQDVSADGVNWLAGTLTGAAAVTTGDKQISVNLTTDSDAGGANLWRMPFVRWRFQWDSGGVANAAVQAKVVYPGRDIRNR